MGQIEQALRVKIGTSLANASVHNVNDDFHPQFLDSPLFVGRIVLRVRNFRGVTKGGEAPMQTECLVDISLGFGLIQVQGRFKQEVNGADLLHGCTWERRVKTPFGSGVVLKLATLIDPTFSYDLHSDKPWTMSTTLGQNTVNVQRAPCRLPEGTTPISEEEADSILGPWLWGGNRELEEDNALLFSGDGPVNRRDSEARRKYFVKKSHREAFAFKPEFVYNFEVFSPFVDFNTMELHMGVKMNLQRLTGQPYTFSMRNGRTGETLWIMQCFVVPVKSLPSGGFQEVESDEPIEE